MRIRTWSAALIALALAGSSCSENGIVAPTTAVPVGLTLRSVSAPSIVISQIYGGGGNSGATLKNDFIELFNPTGQPVDVSRWSVQYASAAGTSWAVTPLLSGTIPAGGYFLVKEAAGANGTVDLPPPNATGSIAMSGTDAKVAVVQNTTALTGACPTGFVDLVSYGSGNCVPPDAAAAQVLTNATADFRKDSGCAFTANPSADFTRAAPSPRNAASPVHVCPGALPLGPLDHVVVAGPTTVTMGTPIQLTATPQDVNNQTVPTATVTWSSRDESIATVDQTGLVTGVAASPNTVGITATAVDNGVPPTSATVQITVAQAQINFIELSSSSSSFPAGFQTQLFATARVFSGGPSVPATFTFEAVDPQIATIATVQNTGIVTGVAAPADGTTKPGFRITATPIGGGTPYSFVTHAITIETPVSAPVSIYAKNDEFGDPTPAVAENPNDLLIVRPQYTISYNESRGTPNWVSY